MQTYDLLQSQYEFTCFAAASNLFDLGQIKMSIARFHQPREIGCNIPKWRGFCNLATRYLLGSEDRLLGLEKALTAFSLIHTVETTNYFSLQAVRAKAETGVPLVVTVWENIPFNHEETPYLKRVKQAVRENTDCFLAVTQQACDALQCEGISRERIRVIGAGIDTERFAPGKSEPALQHQLELRSYERVVLFVGSLSRSKGIYDLIDAARLVIEAEPAGTVRFLLVGQGQEEINLRGQIKRLGLTRQIALVGGFPYAKMPAIHRLADIFVLPSLPTPTWEEQFGMVLAESMATGKAVVSTQSGAIAEVVGNAGILVRPSDPIALAEAIKNLLLDAEKRDLLGRLARQRVKQMYDHQIVAERIAHAYDELL